MKIKELVGIIGVDKNRKSDDFESDSDGKMSYSSTQYYLNKYEKQLVSLEQWLNKCITSTIPSDTTVSLTQAASEN